MTPERYAQIERDGSMLTDDEIAEGWHFCEHWNDMLIGPDSPERENCGCFEHPEQLGPWS